jgi:mRNA-degrading endonuclease RelE of RelBE toxin-antitoxin system
MSYSVYPTPYFRKLFKKLSKKYPSLKDDLQDLVQILKEVPDSGIHIGQGIHKIRIA